MWLPDSMDLWPVAPRVWGDALARCAALEVADRDPRMRRSLSCSRGRGAPAPGAGAAGDTRVLPAGPGGVRAGVGWELENSIASASIVSASCYGHTVDALALEGDEGRCRLR